jgi:hypothetical protein
LLPRVVVAVYLLGISHLGETPVEPRPDAAAAIRDDHEDLVAAVLIRRPHPLPARQS